MSATEITVQYERKFSDQKYGSEGLSMSITVALDSVQSIDSVLNDYAGMLRMEVLSQLAKSTAYAVARAAQRELSPPILDQPKTIPAGGPSNDEDEEDPF